jgi:hypothetical protein
MMTVNVRASLILLVWSLCFILPKTALAQSQPPGVEGLVPFLESSYMTTPTTNQLFFEGRIAIHFTVYRNFVDALSDDKPKRNRNFAVLFTPGVVVRMIKADSFPVRTPSYMPRLDFQQLWRVRYHDVGIPEKKVTADFWEWHAGIGHHSNGQDGCTYLEQGQIPDPSAGRPDHKICVPPFDKQPSVGTPNLKDGNFSTNYLRAGIDHRHSRVDAKTNRATWNLDFGGEYQRQFKTDPNIEKFYPANHAIGRVASLWQLPKLGRVRGEFLVDLAFKQPVSQKTHWNVAP